MKKLFAILATTGALALATPAMAQGIDVHVDNGMHRHHREGVFVRHPRHEAVYVRHPRHVVVVRRGHHWDRGYHHARSNTVVVR